MENNSEQKQLEENGYVIIRNFFNSFKINFLRNEAKSIFEIQFKNFGYKEDFQKNIIRLFNEHEEVFKNCGKLIQTGLIELYELAVNRDLIRFLSYLGINYPLMCTRPVLFFNHPLLAKKDQEVYYKTPQHFDFPSIQSSNNSVVIWIPLVDVNNENGSLILYPGSHKVNHEYVIEGGFAKTKYIGKSIQPELKVGDIIIFSTKLIHESGQIINDEIRWSCSLRFTDMLANDFIEKGYPSPYQYIPITKR